MSDPTQDRERLHVFISYSHADKRWLDRLNVHLTPLGHEYEVDAWSDSRIRPGSKWREEIRTAVEQANVAVLLISADFLASDFVRTNELPPLLRAAEEEGALVLPVIVSPSLFMRNQDLAQFQAVNNPARPLIVASEGEQEAAFVLVAEAILERALSKRALVRTKGEHGSASENFLEASTWRRLIRIGDWILDGDAGRIIGSGMHAYLLSRQEYGESPFMIQTTLEFTNFQAPTSDPALGMNAGIVFGWQSDKKVPRYYNILLTGAAVLIERVGFHAEEAYRDFEHVTDLVSLPILSGRPIQFTVSIDDRQIDVFVNEDLLTTVSRPQGVAGRVGLRPWRSKMDCIKFVVFEQTGAGESAAAAGGPKHRR